MTDRIKKAIDKYREKVAQPKRSEVVSFRVTPQELDRLLEVFGGYTGIRDFALASTDAEITEELYEGRYPNDDDQA